MNTDTKLIGKVASLERVLHDVYWIVRRTQKNNYLTKLSPQEEEEVNAVADFLIYVGIGLPYLSGEFTDEEGFDKSYLSEVKKDAQLLVDVMEHRGLDANSPECHMERASMSYSLHRFVYDFLLVTAEEKDSLRNNIASFAKIVSAYNHACMSPDMNIEDADDAPA